MSIVSSLIFLEQPSTSKINNLINSLNTRKSTGEDELSTYFLRVAAVVIAPILAYLTMLM